MKKELSRLYYFSDQELITAAKEKIVCMRRDEASFNPFGITPTLVTHLEKDVKAFTETVTAIELFDQTAIINKKDAKAEELRKAIKTVMSVVETKYGAKSSRYTNFGAEGLSQQSDSELLVTAKRVVRFGMGMLGDLEKDGLTIEQLDNINVLNREFFELIVDLQETIAQRDIMQEERIEEGNAIFTTLVSYGKTGQAIWEATDQIKYNDYVIYNTQAPVWKPAIQII